MSNVTKSIWLTLAICTSVGCDNGKTSSSASPSATASAITSATLSSSSASAVAAPANAPTGGATTWSGSYKSEAGSIYVPTEVANGKDWKDVKWRGDLSNAGLGDGPMSLAVDTGGRVTGTLDGPLGPATVNGLLVDNRLTATITRKNPTDGGFVGTLVGTLEGGNLVGTMKLSQREASVIRAATFSVAKK